MDDPVTFQISSAEPNFAVGVKSTRVKQRSFVEAMKGDFGFLSYEVETGKKLFFHVTEVEAGDVLVQGDEVEFVVATNKRTGKHSACCVRKIRFASFKIFFSVAGCHNFTSTRLKLFQASGPPDFQVKDDELGGREAGDCRPRPQGTRRDQGLQGSEEHRQPGVNGIMRRKSP